MEIVLGVDLGVGVMEFMSIKASKDFLKFYLPTIKYLKYAPNPFKYWRKNEKTWD
jgi:hypothetical protein